MKKYIVPMIVVGAVLILGFLAYKRRKAQGESTPQEV